MQDHIYFRLSHRRKRANLFHSFSDPVFAAQASQSFQREGSEPHHGHPCVGKGSPTVALKLVQQHTCRPCDLSCRLARAGIPRHGRLPWLSRELDHRRSERRLQLRFPCRRDSGAALARQPDRCVGGLGRHQPELDDRPHGRRGRRRRLQARPARSGQTDAMRSFEFGDDEALSRSAKGPNRCPDRRHYP